MCVCVCVCVCVCTLNKIASFLINLTYAPFVTQNSEYRLAAMKCCENKIENKRNIVIKTAFFQFFDADQEIPTLGSTDNAKKSVNLVSDIIRLPSGWDFSVCIGD